MCSTKLMLAQLLCIHRRGIELLQGVNYDRAYNYLYNLQKISFAYSVIPQFRVLQTSIAIFGLGIKKVVKQGNSKN